MGRNRGAGGTLETPVRLRLAYSGLFWLIGVSSVFPLAVQRYVFNDG